MSWPDYAYLLGLYLGDGMLSEYPRGVQRLRVTLDKKYPGILDECEAAMIAVAHNKVSRVRRPGCFEVGSCWKHWRCLFPQHGPGMKYRRDIVLQKWQQTIALDLYPRKLLRGLIHSDGCRVINWVNGAPYPRYFFSNRSEQILAIFGEACDRLGIVNRRNGSYSMSVAKRSSVALMDTFIGAKE